MPQYLSPNSTAQAARWRNSADAGDSALAPLVDETSPDDADSIRCPHGIGASQPAQVAILNLPAADEPARRLDHRVYIRCWQLPDDGGGPYGYSITVRLTDGSTTKAWTWSPAADPVTYQLDVDEATAEDFAAYDSLSVEIERPLAQGGLYVSWVMAEIPYPPFAHLDASAGGLIVAAAESGYYLTAGGGGIVRITGDETDGALVLGSGGGHGMKL